MARNLGHRFACDLHSGCHAMILTAGFHGDSGLILFRKIEGPNTTILWSNKGRCSKTLRKREIT